MLTSEKYVPCRNTIFNSALPICLMLPPNCPLFFNFIMLLQLFPIPHFIPPHSVQPHFQNQSPRHSPHSWVLHICSLTNLFTTFQSVPTSTFPLTAVSLFHDSMLLVLFCCLIYFVHQIPPTSEIIWYLSFTDWLISLSKISSSSIHAVAKGRNSFFLLYSISLCRQMYHSSFIYSYTDGRLSCFQILVIVHTAAMNIRVHKFF